MKFQIKDVISFCSGQTHQMLPIGCWNVNLTYKNLLKHLNSPFLNTCRSLGHLCNYTDPEVKFSVSLSAHDVFLPLAIRT